MAWLTFHDIFLTFLILFSSTITKTHVFAGNSKIDPCANIFCWNLLSRGSLSRLQIQKLLTDKSKLFVCQISRLGFAYSYITITIITITDWKDVYFLKADSFGQRLERKLLWIYLLCWMLLLIGGFGFACKYQCHLVFHSHVKRSYPKSCEGSMQKN